jgi:hypothetical protein
MPHGVNAAVEAMQLPPLDTVSDCPRPQASAFELSPNGRPMLSLRDLRYLRIRGVAFLSHVGA